MPRRFALALCLTLLSVAAHAQKEVQVSKISRPPAIEEFLNGQERADMKRIDDFRQRQPGDGVPVSQKTSAWIGYDDRNFYAVFVCHVPPGALRARLSRREDIFGDDFVGIFLDTYHDRQRSYEFFVNAHGVQADAIVSENRGDDFSFDTLWYSQGRPTPDGFLALIVIPFRSLRFSPAGVQTWGFGLARFIPANNEASFWPFITQKINGFNSQLGAMTGLEHISPGRNLQLIPYGTFGHSHFLDESARGGPAYRSKTDFRAGLDAKAILRDTLTLDVALNPDFSQVESNDPQVTVNQRYEVQFPEKRPFFLENNAYFSTLENLFFSRRIVDPAFGARLTGKTGRWNLGLLAIDDRAPGRVDDRGGRAAIGVMRVQREFFKQSNIGVLFTDREFAGEYNRVAAVDMRLQSKIWTLEGQAMTSQTRRSNGAHSGGSAFNVSVNRHNRDYGYSMNYTDRSEGFHTDLGFVPRVNIREVTQFLQRRFHRKSKTLLNWSPYAVATINFDHRGVQQDWGVRPGINFEFARSTYLGGSYDESFERFQNINFRRRGAGMGFHSEYFKRLTVDAGYSAGMRINYDAPTGMKPFLAESREFNAQLTIRPAARIKLEELYYLTRLRTLDGAGIFVNHLMRSRLNYQFTRELSLRLILDYNAVLGNPALINLTRVKRVTGDILLTYLIHPGTAFYIGYTDRLENLTVGPGNSIVRTPAPSTTIGRQFFMKMSYLFRF